MGMVNINPCAIIPVYNHSRLLLELVRDIKSYGLPVLLVDDGSDENHSQKIKAIASAEQSVTLVQREANGGKGAAVKTGMRHALAKGYTHGVQIDADGQHNLQDLPVFLQRATELPEQLIAGVPIYDKTVPKTRLASRYLTHVWVWINTNSFLIKDSMCGFRVYPLQRSVALLPEVYGDRMDFDPEFIVRWQWQGLGIEQIETKVIYPDDGVSHFLLWHDNKLISWMHTRLFFGMLGRIFRKPFSKRK